MFRSSEFPFTGLAEKKETQMRIDCKRKVLLWPPEEMPTLTPTKKQFSISKKRVSIE